MKSTSLILSATEYLSISPKLIGNLRPQLRCTQCRPFSGMSNPTKYQQIKQRPRPVNKPEPFDFRTLPKVPSTTFLETQELTNDILLSGYRPIMYPMRENPLFTDRNGRNVDEVLKINKDEKQNNKTQRIKEENKIEKKSINIFYGDRGTGGIKSGGVNGTWKYNPKIPNELNPSTFWSSTSMGMEFFPEWKNIPSYVTKRLKPYDKPLK